MLHVLPRLTDSRAGAAATIDHFALNASDLPDFQQRLRKAGQPFVVKQLADTNVLQMFITDPDGALVELSFAGGEIGRV